MFQDRPRLSRPSCPSCPSCLSHLSRLSLSLSFGLIFLLVCGAALAAATPTVSPRLDAALGDDGFVWRNDDGRLTVWVFFVDKGLAGAALERALDQAENELSARVAWRRAKVTATGQRLVDARDLPVCPRYKDAITRLGAEVRRDSRWLNAASFRMTDTQVRQVAALPFVAKVDLVARFQRTPVPVAPTPDKRHDERSSRWTIDYGGNLAAMEQAAVPAVHEMGINGQGVIIGMLDTGFHTAHEALAGIPVIAAYDFVNDDPEVDNEAGDPGNAKNHGTQTMSTAMGYAPGNLVAPAFGASAVLAKTEDVATEEPIEEDHWVAGLEFVESHGADIVSSSLGYVDWYDWSDMDGNTAVSTIAADLAVARGVIVINSAGNSRGNNWGHINAPADGDSVITVGAVTSTGFYTFFSSPGPSYDGRIKPDVTALGSGNYVADPNNDTGYGQASGTSFSCPLTSGVAALVLSGAPSLTPMQVREALRETASRADDPDNDYGWGIINAYEAVRYFAPVILHEPLADTELVGVPYTVTATITDRVGLLATQLHYRVDGGTWNSVPLSATGNPDEYAGQIPGQAVGAQVDYYLWASGASGLDTRLPNMAPDSFFTFRVGPDVTAPFLAHEALGDQALIMWPPLVQCTAADNLGLDRVELTYTLNGGAVMGPYSLVDDGDGAYSLSFPVDVSGVQGTPNQTVSGPHSFQVIDALGVVLVLDDSPSEAADTVQYYGPDKQPMAFVPGARSSAASIAGWLEAAGYMADVIDAAGVTVADFTDYQLVVLSCGDNPTPVTSPSLCEALHDWVAAGGKLIVESGVIGLGAFYAPCSPDFASEVLHVVDWHGDDNGDLIMVAGQENHPLLNNPHIIAPTVDIIYEDYGDQDAVTPAADAYLVMGTVNQPGDAGILVYDDNLAPQAAQTVYFAFNVEAVAGDFGAQLTENAVRFLLAEELPGTASLAGTVTLPGAPDFSGVLVDAGHGITTITGLDGTWSLDSLHARSYTLTFSKAGWSTRILDVEVADGQALTGLDVSLLPVTETHYGVEPNLAIPDNDPTGITSTITVPVDEAGVLAGVTVDVDIAHTFQGDLVVQLTGPDGTVVGLHDRAGGSVDDIAGNYPESLEVSGPGSLADFQGLDNAGDWVLSIVDNAWGDIGTLNAWGLNFLILEPVSGVGDSGLPTVRYPRPPGAPSGGREQDGRFALRALGRPG
ncbi:hypothetical protein CSA17_04840 [bacterium DOLJORAL78_65_58]|nr:MAG: hypothetical protein CSA17_04840 [bacterium DOLJORAL78_65_58]